MTRVRTPLAAALTIAALASAARADGPPLPNPSLPGSTPWASAPEAVPASPAKPPRGPIRSYLQRRFPDAKKTPRSGHSDWTTGGDHKLSKPWLR